VTLTLSNLNSILLNIFPESWAFEWDNVGLIIGNPDSKITKILLSLDVTSKIIEEAKNIKAQVILTHHPPFLSPPKTFLYSDPIGKIIFNLIKSEIGLISLHTNVDQSPIGINFALAKELGMQNLKFIKPKFRTDKFKFTVFVPENYEEKIIEAINLGGGGAIGNYSHCTFRSDGIGTFKPLEGAHPFIGKKGKFEEVKEFRIESIVPSKNINTVIKEVLLAHPYEEPAFDVYPLHTVQPQYGLGVIGELLEAEIFDEFLRQVKKILGVKAVGVVCPEKKEMKKKIKRIAICTGAGGEIIRELSFGDADVLIIGEAKYSDALEAQEKKLKVVFGGHFATEALFVKILYKQLVSHPEIKNEKIKIRISKNIQNPIKYI